MKKKRQYTRRKPATPRNTFGAALVKAQQDLAEALDQRAYHSQEYHRINASIPNLQRLVQALQAQEGQTQSSYLQPQVPPLPPNYGLEMVVSDVPIPTISEAPQPIPITQPGPRPTKAQGGAIGVIDEGENEDQFLEDAEKSKALGARGGAWH